MTESVQTVAPAPKKELLRGMLAAAGIAAVVLTTAVLPAEYRSGKQFCLQRDGKFVCMVLFIEFFRKFTAKSNT